MDAATNSDHFVSQSSRPGMSRTVELTTYSEVHDLWDTRREEWTYGERASNYERLCPPGVGLMDGGTIIRGASFTYEGEKLSLSHTLARSLGFSGHRDERIEMIGRPHPTL